MLVLPLGGDGPADAGAGSPQNIGVDTVESIASVRVDANEDYVPDRVGDTVKVAGRAVAEPGVFFSPHQIALQDRTAGIHISSTDSLDVARGDSLQVQGVVEHNYGRTEVRALQSRVVDDTARVPDPMPLTVPAAWGETYEGQLVRVRARILRDGENDGGTYLLLRDPGNTSSEQLAAFVPSHRLDRVRLDRFEAGEDVVVTGVLGQFDYEAPYDDYYQVGPRDADDIERVRQADTYLWWALYVLLGGGLLAVGAVVALRLAVRRRTRELAASKARFRRLAEATSEGILIHDGEAVLDVNEAFAAMVGRDREALVGHSVATVLDDTMREGDALARHGPGEESVEAEVLRDEADSVPVEVDTRTVDMDNRTVQVMALRDIAKRKEWEQGLVEAKKEAEQMATLKSNLLSNMSHELRTPITSITGYAELLMDETDGQHREYARRVWRGGQRLHETLQSVLEMAQLEAGTLDVTSCPVDIREVVQEVAEMHELDASDKSLRIHTDVPSGCTARTDRRLLHRIISNLVHNAVKFTHEGALWITAGIDDDCLRIVVRDTGVGIDPETQELLFEAFRQGAEGRDRPYEGAGLGLTITKRMVDVLKGTIKVESTKGEGSTFIVELPAGDGNETTAREDDGNGASTISAER
ncbi:MAG: PAS domain-containing sensor histidine kinase [Salinibacter sp.]